MPVEGETMSEPKTKLTVDVSATALPRSSIVERCDVLFSSESRESSESEGTIGDQENRT